jgi:hypothetical protein
MATQNQVPVDENARKAALNRRLEGFGWAALLIVVGTIWLLPESQVPHGSWLIAAGIILLGLNAIRCMTGISMSRFSIVAGIIALTIGIGEFFAVKLPIFAIALIVVGAAILLKMMFEKDSVSISPAGRGWSCCGRMMQDMSSHDRQGQAVGR